MRLARIARGGSIALLGGVIGSAGCTHNYYYGNVPVCPPPTTVAPGTVQYGASCDVPTQVVGGSSATQDASRAPVLTGSMPPRVVVSEPLIGPPRFPSWRRTDPDSSLATTRVEGALDDPTVTK
jgi:hypothetical protein